MIEFINWELLAIPFGVLLFMVLVNSISYLLFRREQIAAVENEWRLWRDGI